MSQPRPVMLSEVSFSAPSTNTSFPAEYPASSHDPMMMMDDDEDDRCAHPEFSEVEVAQYEQYRLHNQHQDEAAEAVITRCESPTPRKMELREERAMLQTRQNKHHQSSFMPARPDGMALPPKANDCGRSPSPEPFRNYSSLDEAEEGGSALSYCHYSAGGSTDLGTRTPVDMNSSVTSAPVSTDSSAHRSERIRAMTAKIEHLHSRHAPSPLARDPKFVVVGHAAKIHPSPSHLHREEVETSMEEDELAFGPHRRPRSPPHQMDRIARHQSEPNHSVPRTEHRHLMNEGKQCLRQINESLDELRDLLPTHHDVDSAVANVADISTNSSQVSQAKSRRRVMRINELCGKLDGLASVAYQMKLVAQEHKNRRHQPAATSRTTTTRSPAKSQQTITELDHFLEEISRKADSMAYVLEQLATTVEASAETSRQSTGSSLSQVSATRLQKRELTPRTVPMRKARHHHNIDAASLASSEADCKEEVHSAAVAVEEEASLSHRTLLSQKHASSVMDTLEMMADTVLRLADRLDQQNEALVMTMERQQEQQDDVEVTKVVLTDLVHGASSQSPLQHLQQIRAGSNSSGYITVTENQQPTDSSCSSEDVGEDGEYVLRPDPMDVDQLISEQEEVRALPKDVTPNRPRVPISYRPLYSESSLGSADDAEEVEEGYMQIHRSQNTESESERGFQTADHFRQPKILLQRPTSSTINMSAEEMEAEDFQHVTTVHSSVSRHSQHPSSGHLSVPRTGAPHRRIMTPATNTSRHHLGAGTMTEAMMSPHDETGEALHTSRVSAVATQPKLNMYNSASKQQYSSTTTGDLLQHSADRRSAPGTLRSHVLPSEAGSTSSVASIRSTDVSRSLFIEQDQSSSRPTSGSTLAGARLSMSQSSVSSQGGSRQQAHPYYVSSPRSAKKEAVVNLSRELFTTGVAAGKKTDASRKSRHVDIFAEAEAGVLPVEKRQCAVKKATTQGRRDDKIHAAYDHLKRENVSLKDQLESALGHKDHWRSLVEENYSSVLHGDRTGVSPMH